MEENTNKRFDRSVKGTAETALVAYIAVKAFQGVAAVTRDSICFVRARKASKAAESE